MPILLPPAEARDALTAALAVAPGGALLYRLRAQEAEMALDFAAAEADWKAYVAHAPDAFAAQLELADFNHRRLQSRAELTALAAAAAAPDDPMQPATAQRGWQAFTRMAAVAEEDALPEADTEPLFRAWAKRYPLERAAWRKLVDHLLARRHYSASETEIAAYGLNFHDDFEPVRMRADLEMSRGNVAAALAAYDRAFRPLWPEEMRASYFKLLGEQGQLREFAGRARTALAANATDLDATARLFHYFRSQNNVPAARRALLEYRIAKESSGRQWTADELGTAAQLFEWLPDVNEAARLYYALYSIPPAGGPHAERALSGLANLLLTASDQPIQFGSGDLSFYKDIATVDPSPGFLNGILSLLLNWTGARSEYERQNQKSGAYFHRAAAEQLMGRLEREFPNSSNRGPLRAELVSAYGAYGDNASVIRAGREYLTAFPNGTARYSVALQVSDALARTNRPDEEFALYDQLLRELAAKASGVPIGRNATPPAPPQIDVMPFGRLNAPNPTGARSAEYAQVLDKYLSRLASLRRPLDALRVYRSEIDRNPDDPGLYQRLATFVEQNGMSREVEDVYTKAIAKFADRSWYHKLARWYLRNKEFAALEKISRDAIAVFSGSELERYFGDVLQNHPDAVLYRQLNLYAHERFPQDLVFVHNLLNTYANQETRDAAAAERLLRQYWFYDRQLASRLFERLSQQGRLAGELAEIRAGNAAIAGGQFDRAVAANPAAVQFLVEAEAWSSHFESAAPAARALAAAYPGRREFTAKASVLYRSLAAYDSRDTAISITLAGYEQQANPRDPNILARLGDTYADRELFTRARTFWERMPATQPGKPGAYLDTATVYWDYYRYDDALRWIAAARVKFSRRTLFGYQAGAIYEGRRTFPAAVREYVAGALAGESSCSNRLLQLLNRAETRALVDQATAAAVLRSTSLAAVSLRVSVLERLQRRPDLDKLLRARVETERSATELASLQETARRLGFDRLEERAAERLATSTADPVDKMRLTLASARLLESKKDVAGAARAVDSLYRDHPLILGVLRGAVDFHVRNRQWDQAMDLLQDASKHARTDLAAQFTLEAARIATGAGQFDRARTLLTTLQRADPLRGEYFAAMADTYLRAKDDTGFRDYQIHVIQTLRQGSLPPSQRIERIATIRRSLIPAFDRLHDAAGAVDQYIEVLNSYPEDEALTKEVAGYAVAHGQAGRLVSFYRKTATASPLDYRWPVVLGRVETVTEDYPSAITDYERAIKARPDRADVVEAKARLEERLLRFDDAIQSYRRLYELAYRDPQWLIKVAELEARAQRSANAIAALKMAIIGARKETADADFQVAEQLESWHILPDAVSFAERGATLAGPDLFKDAGNAMIYARITARGRHMEPVLDRLGADPSIDQQVAQAAGKVIAETYTPEEKVQLEKAMTERAARMAALLPLAESAKLAGLEARWRESLLNSRAQQLDQRLVTLQSERSAYRELGRELENFAATVPGRPLEATALSQSVGAFIDEGDMESQLRVMRKALARHALSGLQLDRYLALTVTRQPDELLAIARTNGSADIRNRAVQFAIASGRTEVAYAALRTRGSDLPPVWTNALTALAGEYFGDRSAAVDTAFQAALDTRTIGERLKAPLKPDSVIAGAVWYYYGARYGDYLAAAKSPAADAWLPASLEGAPQDPGPYMALGDSYVEAGKPAMAITQFEHALELDPDRGDALDHTARVLWAEGRRPEAIARWKAAIAVFMKIQGRGIRVPEPFWARAGDTFTAIGENHALEQLRGDIANLLSDYYHRNSTYRLNQLLKPAVLVSITSGTGIDWLVELGRTMGEPKMMLQILMMTEGLLPAQRVALQRELVDALSRHAEASFGEDAQYVYDENAGAREQLISMLLDAGDIQAASAEWRKLPEPRVARHSWERDTFRQKLEIRLAAKTGTLGALLVSYREESQSAPDEATLREAALELRRGGVEESARSVLEFAYEREILDGHLAAANFLGLAEVRLQRGDPTAAVSLLNRMQLVSEEGYASLLRGADVLGKYGRTAESIEFVRKRIRAVPWDAEARVQLGRSLPADSPERRSLLAGVVSDSQAAYHVRAQAARLAGAGSGALARTELAILSAPAVTPDAAAQPYQVEARMEATRGRANPAVQARLWREALAIAPTDEAVRLGALRAALAAGHDSVALALNRAQSYTEPTFDSGAPNQVDRGRWTAPRWMLNASVMPKSNLTDEERASLAESLASAARRQDDLNSAQGYLKAAMNLRPESQRPQLKLRLDALAAEQDRRTANGARQPIVKDIIEQGQVVRQRIPGSVQ